MRPIDLTDFAEKFAANDDPWRTYSDRDEAVKRAAILHAWGQAPLAAFWNWEAATDRIAEPWPLVPCVFTRQRERPKVRR